MATAANHYLREVIEKKNDKEHENRRWLKIPGFDQQILYYEHSISQYICLYNSLDYGVAYFYFEHPREELKVKKAKSSLQKFFNLASRNAKIAEDIQVNNFKEPVQFADLEVLKNLPI